MASKFQCGYDDERFETIVNRNFHCLICYNVLKEPVMCRNNQHYFCRGCITEHLRRNSRTCPTCADDLTVETLTVVPRIVQDYLDELNICCEYYDRGCRELIQLQNLEQHVDECGFTPVQCGNQGCDEIIDKRDRKCHETEQCRFRKVECHNCEKISTVMAGMETEIKHLSSITVNVTANEQIMKTKFEHLSTSIANTDEKLANMDTQIANFNENVEAKFEAVNKLNNEVKEIKASLNEVKDGFEQLKEAVFLKITSEERKQDEITDASGGATGGKEEQHIFVAGGAGSKSVEMFNYRQRLWSLLYPLPVPRDSASSFVYNNHVTVAGGAVGHAFDSMIQMNVHPIPDPSMNWSDFAAKLPAKMYAHSSVVYEDSLFLFGGYNKDENVISDRIYEIQLKPPYTVKMVAKMPEPRAYHSTVMCDDDVFIIGGTTTKDDKDSLSSVLSYDIKKNICRPLPALPYAVTRMATVRWAENAVIIGGVDKVGHVLNDVTIYNTRTGHSHMLPPMLHKRHGCAAVVIQNRIVVLGGCDKLVLKLVEGFSFGSYSWEELPQMKEGKWLPTAVVV